ncbi:hypothetical protein Tco_0511652 [Tanacetum coccineum]
MADKYEYEKRKKEKLEEVKARLDFGDARKKSTRAQESAYSESRTISPRRQRRSRSPRHNPSVFTRLRRERLRSPRHEYKKDGKKGEHHDSKRHGNQGRNEANHVKTYNGSEDPEDHLKIFQAAAKTESYNDLREAFLKNYLQQKKCIRDPIVLHNIKKETENPQKTSYKGISRKVEMLKEHECMRISRIRHKSTNPRAHQKISHEKIPKTVDRMMQYCTSFLPSKEGGLKSRKEKSSSGLEAPGRES